MLDRCGAVGNCPDLLNEDVGVAGVASHLGDHAEVDEAQAYCADKVVVDGVVETVVGGNVI